ncbi:SRPBCC domain-containing protein [Bacillus sp. NEB1478]|uniref:SRPBCC domain-containing protein n=1 Tax=Bacillus sp. NEB1478 TaxID=3073816 RepID=UPI002873DD29|nr:SRPBCC domain-containing protein [Bacillus sp. NEB1478]WNB92251.1 SRPBCC domain-containing protein [Bacillus sp. NEB1478]
MSTKIQQEIVFETSRDRVYQALLNEQQFSKMSGGAPTSIVAEEGGSFSCFGGMILGRTIELVPNERIVQAWRAANWEPGVYSIVTFELNERGNQTLLKFTHSGFPEGQDKHLAAGWHENYWNPLQTLLSKS